MKWSLLAAAASLLIAAPLLAQAVSGQAIIGFQQYDYDSQISNGLRQLYTLCLDRAISDAARFHLTFRGEGFDGREDTGRASLNSTTRVLQPTANLSVDVGRIHLLAKSDYIDDRSDLGGAESTRTTKRSMGLFSWQPERLPQFAVTAQRNSSVDDVSNTSLTDEYVLASSHYDFRGLQVNASENYNRSLSPTLGYTRSMTAHSGDLQYANSYFGGRMTLAAEAGARFTRVEQRANAGAGASVPNPIAILHAYSVVDETPADNRDHPLVSTPALIDGDLNRNVGISLGPDGSSFENIAIDASRLEHVDEVRVLVRDRAGDPLRRGGGAVTWDAYTSTDGIVWTQIPSAVTQFNSALSYYSVTFDQTMSRWVKVVSFGLNSDEDFVTEIQAYYHTNVAGGASSNRDQNSYLGSLSTSVQPTTRLTLSYSGVYNALKQNEAGGAATNSTDLSHIGSVQYQIARAWTVRGQYTTGTNEGVGGLRNSIDGFSSFLDWIPTAKLRMSAEFGDNQQTLGPSRFSIQTRALHTAAYIIPSVSTTLDFGVQNQTFEDGHQAHGEFALLTLNAQLTGTLRSRITGSLQRTDSTSADPAVLLLGPQRDYRESLDLSWRPGDKLTITGRFGYAEGLGFSGFNHRYHVEWIPFGEGTVSLAGSYDRDIDPASGRTATRVIFNPRWAMNRHAAIEFNYTAVASTSGSDKRQQKLAFATLTLTK